MIRPTVYIEREREPELKVSVENPDLRVSRGNQQ